jgi:hypothetical protein
MDSDLVGYILTVCEVLNKHSINYMIVGGVAVALHGHFRKSIGPDGKPADKPDMDIWYDPTYDNYFRLLDALEELGQDVEKFKKEQAPNPKKSFFKYDLDEFTLDFLPILKAKLPFQTSFKRKEIVSLEGVDIPFISYEDLIIDKKANPRQKDMEDIEYLKTKRHGYL